MTNFSMSRKDLLKKQFMFFKYLENETVDDIGSRYYHLLLELVKCDVSYTNTEVNETLLNALPPKFEKYSVLIKKNEKLTDMSLADLIGTVHSYKENDMTEVSEKSDDESVEVVLNEEVTTQAFVALIKEELEKQGDFESDIFTESSDSGSGR
ncbi:hypothetical protein L1987_09223 [Smallanthus sonchifolius]|uniref:Uncharacterized protein n=1 Tax=Smallanthus sonchifolius TaxID=185202 RepID=A0ACB9JMU1_9ASTR|nr:hypothetical protein L1987_09223 [Smallanthus sonchifolius]